MRHWRIVLGVTVAWLAIGFVLAASGMVGAWVQGQPVESPGSALTMSMVQVVPWIPATLFINAVATHFPVSRTTWRRHVPLHMLASALVTIVVNALLVLGFWSLQGRFNGFVALGLGALRWATVNAAVGFVVYSLVVAGNHALTLMRESRARELRLATIEHQLTRAQLDALNAQIRPHFLFNTLHTIGQLWRSGRHDEADAMLDHLGSLFHRVQASSARRAIPLSEEIELVRSYLTIEEARFRDRLHVSERLEDRALDCLVPPLILQPIVENAIRHGIAASPTAGRLAVAAALVDGHVIASVTDDGPGMGQPSASPGSGTGLRNTRERLHQLYGEAATLAVEAPVEGGTRVVLRLPAVSDA